MLSAVRGKKGNETNSLSRQRFCPAAHTVRRHLQNGTRTERARAIKRVETWRAISLAWKLGRAATHAIFQVSHFVQKCAICRHKFEA